MTGSVVHIVEDDGSVRVALARLLDGAGYVTRSYSSAAEFLLARREHEPGCIVLDVGLPGFDGMELQAALANAGDRRPIVFVTGMGDIEMSVRAMKAGAVDFLTKPVKTELLLKAVETAVAHEAEERAAREHTRAARTSYGTLTLREREVFARVVEGKLNKEIAFELGTSIRTVKAHRAQVMKKMEVGSLAELVSVADHLGRR
jgi:FixJ family two-component response regulator